MFLLPVLCQGRTTLLVGDAGMLVVVAGAGAAVASAAFVVVSVPRMIEKMPKVISLPVLLFLEHQVAVSAFETTPLVVVCCCHT